MKYDVQAALKDLAKRLKPGPTPEGHDTEITRIQIVKRLTLYYFPLWAEARVKLGLALYLHPERLEHSPPGYLPLILVVITEDGEVAAGLGLSKGRTVYITRTLALTTLADPEWAKELTEEMVGFGLSVEEPQL